MFGKNVVIVPGRRETPIRLVAVEFDKCQNPPVVCRTKDDGAMRVWARGLRLFDEALEARDFRINALRCDICDRDRPPRTSRKTNRRSPGAMIHQRVPLAVFVWSRHRQSSFRQCARKPGASWLCPNDTQSGIVEIIGSLTRRKPRPASLPSRARVRRVRCGSG